MPDGPLAARPDDDEAMAVARAVARQIVEADGVTPALGIALDEIGPGRATVSMTATDTMVNGHGIVHGGFLFVLADCAFALACNSHGVPSVARSCDIEYVRPAALGDRLVAAATERRRLERGGIYDVAITAAGELVAEFRGHSRHYRAAGG